MLIVLQYEPLRLSHTSSRKIVAKILGQNSNKKLVSSNLISQLE